MLSKHPDRNAFADAVNRPATLFARSDVFFVQQTIIRRRTNFQKLLTECRIQAEIPVFFHRRNELGQ